MSGITLTPFAGAPTGYSAQDCALQDVLFGLDLDDETPDGLTRTWVYSEGAADDAGRFEQVGGPDTELIRRQPVLQLVKVDTPRLDPLHWQRASPSPDRGHGWPNKTF